MQPTRVVAERRHELLEGARLVARVEIGQHHDLAARRLEDRRLRGGLAAAGQVEHAHARVRRGQLVRYGHRPIARAVRGDDHLEGEGRRLGEDVGDSIGDLRFTVVHRDADADQRRPLFARLCRREPDRPQPPDGECHQRIERVDPGQQRRR